MGNRDWLYLPPDFGEDNDPVGTNPFPAGTTLHKIWAEATAIAHSEYLALQKFLAAPKRAAELTLDFPGLVDWFVIPHVAKFEIWAKRGVHVVVTDGLLADYERWLHGYANSWLGGLANFFEKSPPPFAPEPLLVDFRNRLAQRVVHWRGEGRRFLAEQVEYRRSLEAAERPKTVGVEVKQKRKALIAAYKRKHELTAEGFAMEVGVSTTGIRGLIKEDRSRFSDATQSNFLALLGLSKEDWYSS